jgi:hypothetical protein
MCYYIGVIEILFITIFEILLLLLVRWLKYQLVN